MAKKKVTPVVMTKAQVVKFWNDPSIWGKEQEGWIEDETITVNGNECAELEPEHLKDADVVEIYDGTIWKGPHDGDILEDVARKWLAAQNIAGIIVEVDRAKLPAMISAIESAGGTIANKSGLGVY